MMNKCKKCGKFLPADATSELCAPCEVAAATQLAKKVAEDNPVPAPPAAPSVFKLEMPTYVHGQTGGIKTWLGQVEIRLKLAKITGELEKYEYLVAGLPSKILSGIYNLVNVQPASDPYGTLVNRIEAKFQPDFCKQIQKLLQGMVMGDKKPSLFLQDMQQVAGTLVAESVLRELFLYQLPKYLKDILTVIESASLASLAKAAD